MSHAFAAHPPIKRCVIDICTVLTDLELRHLVHALRDTYLDKLLTPRITGIQFDRSEPLKLRTEMCACGLSDARWARD